jgi:transcriptional regulator with XRE-family HTH domain
MHTAMTSVGEILRTQRKNQGCEVDEIAAKLCITSSYVSSIERDDLKTLPGVFFYKSFVKQYAATVGLDYAPLRSLVEALVALEPAPALPRLDSRPGVILRTCARLRIGWNRAPQPPAAPPLLHL